MKKLTNLLLVLFLLGTTACSNGGNQESNSPTKMVPGTYTQTVNGMHAPITVELTVDESSIVSAKIVDQMETMGMGDLAAERIAEDIVKYQSLDVDLVSGATITSAIVKDAFKKMFRRGRS